MVNITPFVPKHVPIDHPLVTKDYSLYTPSIGRMEEVISEWIDNQVDGGTIFGPSRFGKSSAVNNWLQSLLSERFGGFVPLVIWRHIDSGGGLSAARFYSQILEASRHHLARAVRSPLDRQHMLLERFTTLAMQSGGRFVVLVIDEAQGMTQREWLWLVQIHSQLDQRRVRLCVISIASLQFFDEPVGLALSGGAHVASRFMLVSSQFSGVKNSSELNFVIRSYDEGAFWPENSKISFTQGVAPKAWDEGFRMSQISAHLWNALVDNLPRNYRGKIEFPMSTISTACRNILLKTGGAENWKATTNSESISKTIKNSSHESLMRIVGATAPLAKD